MKKLISALLAAGICLLSIPAMASDINITINGEEFIPKNALGQVVEPFIENGSTYLPVRAMGTACGKEVAFDAENYAVYIGVQPMAEDVTEYPYAMIEDVVFTEGFVNLGYRAADFINAYKIEKLVEKKLNDGTLSEIDIKMARKLVLLSASMTEETIETKAASLGMTKGELEKHLTYLSYQDALIAAVSVPESEYEKYVTVKHILTKDEESAKEVIAKLESGADFDSLMEEYNEDPGQTKGSSYTFTYGDMVEPFEKAAFELKENEYTKQPVGTDYGYHVILRLPLIKTNVDTYDYCVNKVVEEINSIKEPEKMVYVSGDGDSYGVIEGIEITNREFELIGITLDTDYSQGFEYLKELFAIVKVCENGFLSEEEIKAAKEVDITELPEVSEEFATFFLGALNMISMAEDKFYEKQNAYTDFIALTAEELENVTWHVNRDIRIYVDGKILIPSDVNNSYVRPKNIDGTVYVPVRAIVEALGMSADWDNDNRCVVITK